MTEIRVDLIFTPNDIELALLQSGRATGSDVLAMLHDHSDSLGMWDVINHTTGEDIWCP